MNQISKIVLVVSALALGACVTKPYDEHIGGDFVYKTYEPAPFEGWASKPNATLNIQGKRKDTGAWQTVATTTSSSSGFGFGGETLYHWTASFILNKAPNWECLLSRVCQPGQGSTFVTFRVREVGGRLSTLVTHTEYSFECTIDKVQAGYPLADAYLACDPPDDYTQVRVAFLN